MLLSLLTFGGFWFWTIAIIVMLFCIATVENERGSWATISLIAFLVLCHLFGDAPILSWVLSHGLETVGLVTGYFVIGTAYSILKWHLFTTKMASAASEALARYDANKVWNSDELDKALVFMKSEMSPEELIAARNNMQVYIPGFRYNVGDLLDFNIRDHKSRIMLWISHWPFSAAWTLVNDPVRALTRHIYESLSRLFKGIAQRSFRGLDIRK